MITLATLPQATEQEVFDQVAIHLLTQNRRSLISVTGILCQTGACAYRGDDGCKCAAGSLISDDEYFTEMEGDSWRSLSARDVVPIDHLELIIDLQRMHDANPPELWPERLEYIAISYELNDSVIDNFVKP